MSQWNDPRMNEVIERYEKNREAADSMSRGARKRLAKHDKDPKGKHLSGKSKKK